MLLLQSNVNLKYTADFRFVYENNGKPNVVKNVSISEGLRIYIKFYSDDMKQVLSTEAVVKDIYKIEGRKSNVIIRIDASSEFESKTYDIPSDRIVEIDLFGISEIPVSPTPAINWTLDKVHTEKNEGNVTGLLVIPYCRSQAGTICLKVSDIFENVLFREKYVATTVNEKASFSFTLRDFSGVAKEIEEENALRFDNYDLLIEDGFYIFQNGDESNPIIINTDRDNSLIIDGGTPLVIEIEHHTNYGESDDKVTTISTGYVVKAKDVELVTFA